MTTLAEPTAQPDRPAAVARGRGRAALGAWVAVVTVGLVWGRLAVAHDPRQALGAAPLAGRWSWHGGVALLPAVAFGVSVARWGPAIATRWRWPHVAVAAGATSSAWTVLLAVSDGWSRLAAPLATRYEYVPFASTIDAPSTFVRTFTERAPHYPVHVRGHPPGATLAFWLLDRAGLRGSGWAAGLVVVAWGVGVAAVVVALGEVAGRSEARRAAPFVALLPAAVWAGTSADALFAGVAATGVALVVLASGRDGPRAAVLSACGGAVSATALHLTYGALPLLALPAVVVVRRRRFDVVVPAVVGAGVVAGLWLAAGFSWLDGLATTRAAYWAGVAARRPWPYHVLAGNPAALALAAGPAVAAAAAYVRGSARATLLLATAAVAALVVADASGLSKGEVERIWLPFVPWVTTATAVLPSRRRRAWLLGQVGVAVVLQASLRSPW